MNNIEIIEIILVCLIVGIQLFVFGQTYSKIKSFKEIIPNIKNLGVSKLYISLNELNKVSPSEILDQKELFKYPQNQESLGYLNDFDLEDNFISDYENDKLNSEDLTEETTEVTIIENSSPIENTVFEKILFSINNYLIRNRGTSSDFNLIKDIVERNINAEEEDINLTISIPLYLGLMGTMIGIVIALFHMPSISADINPEDISKNLDEGIAILIGGVKIAMIASFIGLGLTILNSGWVFKGSRSYNENKKNELYTFIQIELLPIINQGLSSTFDSLQRNLLKFNTEFAHNLRSLTSVFESNKDAMQIQKDLIESLDKTKVAQMTRYNVQVLQELNFAVEKFEKFNTYMSNVTEFVGNTQLIVGKTNELLARTDNLQKIAEHLEYNFKQSQQLIEFLNAHFLKLEEHKELTERAVADVGISISDTFNELNKYIEGSSEAIKLFTIEEADALRTALSQSRTNLSNLEFLSTLKTDVSGFKENSSIQAGLIKQSLDGLNRNMADSLAILRKLEDSGFNIKVGLPSIKKLFNSKK